MQHTRRSMRKGAAAAASLPVARQRPPLDAHDTAELTPVRL
jgi:hypothetical protein